MPTHPPVPNTAGKNKCRAAHLEPGRLLVHSCDKAQIALDGTQRVCEICAARNIAGMQSGLVPGRTFVTNQHYRRLLAVALATTLALGSPIINPISAQAKDKDSAGQLMVPIAGAVSGINTATGQPMIAGHFQGTATITGFAARGSQLVALGTISGLVSDGDTVVSSVVSNFSVPVTVPTSTTPTATNSTVPGVAAVRRKRSVAFSICSSVPYISTCSASCWIRIRSS